MMRKNKKVGLNFAVKNPFVKKDAQPPAASLLPSEMAGKICTIRKTETIGRGIFAVKDIKPGELILDERPLVEVPELSRREVLVVLIIIGIAWQNLDSGLLGWFETGLVAFLASSIVQKLGESAFVCSRAGKLDEEGKQAYYSLTSGFADSWHFLNTLMIFRSNKMASTYRGGVYAKASVLNHSCVPNAYHYWNEERQRMMVHAIKPIEKNQEITICYIEPYQTREDRQAELKQSYNFDCKCIACCWGESKRANSDGRRECCARVLPKVQAGASLMSEAARIPLQLDEVEKLAETIDKEFGSPTYLGDLYWEAYATARQEKKTKEARAYATQAQKYLAIMRGSVHPNVKAAKKAQSQ
eukprot:TRINITY_DN10602_c0_g1_i1.p1 TRINITY_DN10602_c0_g1~~TRINITY_DN10602_c0_g1_i1.p1  ORF type:complete len:357 (-),score=81.43 TRINITY_DN10602_c0_g1_i1:418-1488(-)